MGLTKHAEFRVLAARIAPAGGGPLMRTAHRHEFEYEPKPGFLYVRSRAISSRTNDNFDNFPGEEIKKAYRTFVGKPVFVNHHNDNHRRARGVIKDAVLHEDVNPDGTEDTWVEVLMEVDAVRFPKLAQAILDGHIDRTSMGTDVQFSVCSVCNNRASSPVDYCKHIPKMKGQKVWRTTASGEKEGVLVYEKCYGLGFFENSLLVEEPADPTAYFLGVDARGLGKAASLTTTARGYADTAHAREVADASSLFPRGRMIVMPQRTVPAWCAACRWEGTGDQVAICPNCEERDGFVWAVDTEDDTLSRNYNSPALQHAACTCGWNGRQGDVADCPRCGSNHSLFFGNKFHTHYESARTAVAHAKHVHVAADEKTLAPADVDTLRAENCPVCGESSAFDGDRCQVCGFVTPPSEFGDPDTDAAKATDLRQENDDAKDKGGDLACDNCGATFASEGHGKTALVLDPEKGTEDSDDAASTAAKAGDSCPTCGQGTLQPAAAPTDADAPADDDGFAPAGSASEDDADDQDGADGSDGEDGEDGDKPDFLKKKDKNKPTAVRSRVQHDEGADVLMRPALAALAAQQKQIEDLRSALAFVVEVAGLQGHPRVASLSKQAVDENPAFGGGWDNMQETAPKAPVETTEQAAQPTAKDDVESIGSTPLTDVTPDATTDLASDGVVLDVTEPTQDDVTAPVAGTETLGNGERGEAGANRTETEVRVGEPSDNSAAFRDGGFLGSQGRTLAALRLARLQVQAGIASGDDLEISEVIASSDRSDESIQTEIDTLAKVVTATRQPQRVARNLVPQGARQAQRMVPSMTATAASSGESIGSVSSDEMLFEA